MSTREAEVLHLEDRDAFARVLRLEDHDGTGRVRNKQKGRAHRMCSRLREMTMEPLPRRVLRLRVGRSCGLASWANVDRVGVLRLEVHGDTMEREKKQKRRTRRTRPRLREMPMELLPCRLVKIEILRSCVFE